MVIRAAPVQKGRNGTPAPFERSSEGECPAALAQARDSVDTPAANRRAPR
jgi:hypothetical protein